MSLLDKAPHTVTVIFQKESRDAAGRRVMTEVAPRQTVRCMVEPVREWSSAEEELSYGLQVTDMAVLRARKWPGNVDSHVIFNDVLYETVGAEQHFSVGRMTRHYRVTLKRLKEV